MKNKQLLLALGLLLAGGFFSACKQGSNLTDTMPMKTSGGSTPAHPEVCFVQQQSNSQYAIVVADSDGSHQAIVWSNANITGTGLTAGFPSWSPGNTILFDTGHSICAIDVSVNSSGVPVG